LIENLYSRDKSFLYKFTDFVNFFVTCFMKIREIAANRWREVVIEKIERKDAKLLTKKRYFFKWKEVRPSAQIFVLRLRGDKDVKGVMALEDWDSEKRIEIELIAASEENVIFEHEKGKKQKEFEGIIGILIAFACREAIYKYGTNACVSLIPKTDLRRHYIKEYNMVDAGWQVYVDGENLKNLISKYLL
jgi:hypothetical protein